MFSAACAVVEFSCSLAVYDCLVHNGDSTSLLAFALDFAFAFLPSCLSLTPDLWRDVSTAGRIRGPVTGQKTEQSGSNSSNSSNGPGTCSVGSSWRAQRQHCEKWRDGGKEEAGTQYSIRCMYGVLRILYLVEAFLDRDTDSCSWETV